MANLAGKVLTGKAPKRPEADPNWKERSDEPSGVSKAFEREGSKAAGEPVLHGWGNYFRTGNADREFNKIDCFVVKSLRRWQYRRGGQRPTKRAPFSGDQLYDMGLHRLMGTVKYPAKPHKEDHPSCAGKRHARFERDFRNGPA